MSPSNAPKFETWEDKLPHLIAQTPVLVATFKGPGYIVETLNNVALEIWSTPHTDVINKPFFETWPEQKQELKQIFDDVYSSGIPVHSNEKPIQLKRSGKPDLAYFSLVYQPLRDAHNSIYGIILIGWDITETVNYRKQIEISELFNRTILENSPDCIKVLDVDGKIQFINKNGLAHLEIDNFSALKNKDWFSLWGAENELLVKECFNNTLLGETAKFTAMRYTAKGVAKWWDVVVSPIGYVNKSVHQIISVARDVTDQKKSAEVIEKTALHLNLATESANVGVWSLNVKTQELDWSGLHKRMWGYDENRSDLSYEDWYKIILPGDEALALKKVEEARINNSFYEVEYRIRKADDHTIRYIKSVGKYHYNKSGEPETLTGISMDITEQKNAEEVLRKTASHFKHATDSANVGVWSLDVKKQELEWSGLHKRMWGYDEYRTDLTYEDWYKVIVSEDREFALRRVEEARINHSFYEVEYRIKKVDDQSIHFIRSFGKYDYDLCGEAETLSGISMDITEQKLFEEKLYTALSQFKIATEAANVGVWSLDVATEQLEWSGLHKKMWGYDENRTDLKFEDWHSIILSEDKALAFQKVEEAKQTKSIYEVEYRIERPNDKVIRWMKAVGQFYYNEAGEAVTLTGISLDITDQKTFTDALENKVKERTKELDLRTKQLEELNSALDINNFALESANAELKSFNYIASHDLQEPLRMIRMFSKRITDAETFTPKTQGYFNFIISATERMRNLIASLIEYSKTNRNEQEFVPCDLNKIVDESKKDLHLFITEKIAIIEIEELPTINGMYFQLCQLFTNLIGNALKYSKSTETPSIKITSEKCSGLQIEHQLADKQLEYYAIKVADNGIGFEEEYKCKIFEVFQRLHGRDEYSGTGIGLAIVKKIVTNHNGIIIAEGQPNIGATFSIYLPVEL